MTKKSRDSLKRNTKKHKAYLSDTSSVSNKASYSRQSRLGSEICKTPGWAVRLMKSSPLQRERYEEVLWCAKDSLWSPELRNHPLLSAVGTSVLTDKEAILKRWAKHFDSVLNRPSSINDDAINRLLQMECNLLLDEFSTVTETVKAIKFLSSRKAPGSDTISAEIYKVGGSLVAKKMTE